MTYDELPSPCYILDEAKLRSNCEVLKSVSERTDCRILLAQKAFSCFYEYPLIRAYLDGTTASSLFEAKLGAEEFRKENHIFAPAYLDSEFDELTKLCDHIVFNSLTQYETYRRRLHGVSAGLRINPECPTQKGHEIYDPCRSGSRMGITAAELKNFDFGASGIEGLHFHTLCEQNADDLETTLAAVRERFGTFLSQVKWVNFGGGHHITRSDYDLERLIRLIRGVQEQYGAAVYLEPGEAVALNAGYLKATVLDTVKNGNITNLILDASAACHMPDVLEMPYRPPLFQSGEAGEKAYTYRLGGNTCLAGDIIGDYSFDRKLEAGDTLLFEDMAIYSICKNNTFNGIALPALAAKKENGTFELIRSFGYGDFKNRLS